MPSNFQPGIPTGTVRLSIDYQNLQKNFQQLDTTFGIDHTLFSNQTAQNGYHKTVHMIPISTVASRPPNNQPINAADYTATPGFGQLLNAEINDGINTDTALYFLTGGNRLLQLTRNFVPVTSNNTNHNGYTFLPGGLIFQWGRVTSPGSSGQVLFVTNNINFPTAIFNVTLTLERNSGDQSVTLDSGTTPSITQFSYLSSSSGSAFLYWTALGR